MARALNTFFCCRTLSVIETCDANLVSTLLSIAAPQAIFLSAMNCLAIIWCRSNGFCLREIQVTTLATLSKQSRKKGSFHYISAAGASPIRLACNLMDLAEDPTFFKKTSIPCAIHTKHCTQGHFSLSMTLSVLSMTLNVLSLDLNVLRIWFALLHLLGSASQAQVVPGADGPE